MAETPFERFRRLTGSAHFLTVAKPERVSAYLTESDFLIPGEEILHVTPAGEGNMNVTLRVITNRRQFIVKQSRPWVARFPDIEAPVARILVERHFYQAIAGDHFLVGRMPEILRADARNYVLILEDLGVVPDLTSLYQEEEDISRSQLSTLLQFASRLHHLHIPEFEDNRALKELNHQHIFDLPFRPDNGFPLDAIYPGLAKVALPFQHDERLRAAARELGQRYLGRGTCLVHGDFYPGSFLRAERRVFVIDAEFAHLGRPEFDVGVLMAHLLMSRAPEKRLLQIDTDYDKPSGFDASLTRSFCYVEIIRRLIGIAQLPVTLSLDERKQLLERARAGLL
ncbi:5-methylthioribose kinase [Lewinella marina]|uniref:Aminoglycoside phosphotransferase n=1 Tax=Neolewinella marina TaxID=438751 RepID=A0A2G0CDS6_9BACT|nr:phosphotransferase [Neolewinella marina]NJB85894.1 5-methylthioribose kinase [Neolewinella marina]PHK98129.1 aminoglycoside phosphotransferase [Neolewinella marina]